MSKRGFINKNGFSLIELSIGVVLLGILASAVMPNFIMGIRQEAAKKTAVEVSQIQEAARKFYVDKGSWPADLPTLAAGYLDPTWAATNLNPFGNPYIVSVTSPNLLVKTDIPTDVNQVAVANLQMATVTGQTVQSSVTPPGGLNSVPVGGIIPWPGSTLPLGFLWCNGQNVSRVTYSGLFAVIGTIYGSGDGSTTFGLPNTMGRTIVGVDSMGGASAANRITLWGSSPAAIGGTFGEDKHQLTIAEMPSHHFSVMINDATTSGGTRYPETVGVHSLKPYDTNTLGNDQLHNVVQPSIAMGYIIKY